jgi:PAS domain S-box-containing protein
MEGLTMILAYNYKQASAKLKNSIFITFLIVLILSLIASFFMHQTWIKYLNVYHTILELVCVFIALAIFFSGWYNYERISLRSRILSFGFLTVAVFDALHAFYHLKLNLASYGYFDLSTRYWILGRFTEVVVIFMVVAKSKVRININKFLALSATAAIAFSVVYFTVAYHDYLPILLTDKGVTPIKIMMEYIIIFICLTNLYRIKDKLYSDENIEYKYIFLSLIMMIPSEVFFTLYSDITSITWTTGHVLKIVSYYFLFKGTFVNSIVFPYARLELEHKELEQVNEEIKQMTETLNDVLDALPMAVYMYDENSKVKYVNKKFEELSGCDRNQIYGITAEQSLERFPRLEREDKILSHRVLEGDINAYKTIRTYRTASGEYKKVSIMSNKINGGGIALLREAKEEQELKNLNLQTETILDSVSNCVLMIDNNNKILLCNTALEELLELNKDQIIGMDINCLYETIKFEQKQIIDLMLSENLKGRVYEGKLTTINGNVKELQIYRAQIKNVDEEIIGSISISSDVTHQKKEQVKIQQQEKLALLGQLGAGIVHETRNFLTTIKGRCQLIEAVADNEKIKAYAAKINNDVDEVNRIISEFLFLSKPRDTELEEVSMYDIFQSIKNIVETSSLVKGVDISMEISKEERYLMCDEVQIKQVILNICKNAVDAMSDTKYPKLSIATGYNEASNEMFIKVSDNGKGMTEEQKNKIGTMFYTTKKTGTGLGLNVCYQIIKDHKGRIEVNSKLDEGTAFTILLPCIEEEEVEEVVWI